MRQSSLTSILAALCLVAWVGLAFVAAIPSGWVHVPLALAALAAVGAIVATDAERADE